MNDSSVKLAAAVSYLVIAASVLSGLVVTPWVVAELGQADYGLYTLANSLGALLAVDLGLSAATAKFVAKYRADNAKFEYSAFLKTIFTAFLVLDLVVLTAFACVWIWLDSIMPALTASELSSLRTILVIVGVQTIFVFPFFPVNGILSGNERFVSLRVADLLVRILSVGAIGSCLLLGGGLNSIVAANCGAIVIGFAFKFVRCWRAGLLTAGGSWRRVRKQMRVVVHFSVWTMLITFAQRATIGIAPPLLAGISGSLAVAVFGVAAMLEGYVWLLANAVNGLFLPRVTRLVVGSGQSVELDRLVVRVGRFQLIILGLVVSGFLFAGSDFIGLWLGAEFEEAHLVAAILLAPSVFLYTQEVMRSILIATDQVKWNAFGALIGAIISLSASLLLIPAFGAKGAGMGVSLGWTVGLFLFMILFMDAWPALRFGAFFGKYILRCLPRWR